MDAFALRQRVIGDYASYVHSFLKISDPRVKAFVDTRLSEGALWPEPLVQLSPSYADGPTVQEVVDRGLLHPECARIFRRPTGDTSETIKLYQHQWEALQGAASGHNVVLTSGTGSGKSLAYLIPIFDHVLRNNPDAASVRAIIVYPMNALVNSQDTAIRAYAEAYAQANGRPMPVRVARYTGQETEEQKEAVRANPPHVLLTNYVMLELMLTRPAETTFVDAAAARLQFLVLDEMHTYRGRQGADVAMLVRRLRERCGNSKLVCIGTSATMATEGTRDERTRAVAEVAARLFGVPGESIDVVGETLRRAVPLPRPVEPSELRAAVAGADGSPRGSDEVGGGALAAWVEDTFGLSADPDGTLRRQLPIPLSEGAASLAEATGMSAEDCRLALQRLLLTARGGEGSETARPLAFKLHQFISQGGSVYATYEPAEMRLLTLEGAQYAPGGKEERLLFPLAFCRECGQEYYLAQRLPGENLVLPRSPTSWTDDLAPEAVPGYLLLDGVGIWSDDRVESLPDTWFEVRRGERRLKKTYRDFEPEPLTLAPDGRLGAGAAGWFMRTPFLTCLRCGVAYDKRTNDFAKLTRLSSEGRATATTLLAISAVTQMREERTLAPEARKVLSFTDNRQDASLQAGHFNDFVQVGLLRSALYRALEEKRELHHDDLARAVVDALNLPDREYAREEGIGQRAIAENRKVFQELVEYRLYEDLRRGWRILQPNLEQCGLLKVAYGDLAHFVRENGEWQGHPILASATPETRERVLGAVLDHMRRNLALTAECLRQERQEAMCRRIRQRLREPWGVEEDEERHMKRAKSFIMPDAETQDEGFISLSARSAVGKYLRSPKAWPELDAPLPEGDYQLLLNEVIRLLRGGQFITDAEGRRDAVQLRVDCLAWRPGDGALPEPDPIRARSARPPDEGVERLANPFFADLYKTAAEKLAGLEGREHTGQVAHTDREEREKAFREGKLSCLFCSPTMELGIDIADLNAVHLRNLPPTPANYAQRSGRAGRSGQPALVLSYAAVGSGHDQYYFRRPQDMVAGAVAPPRLDLNNEDLLRAHVHAVWLAVTGLRLGRSISDTVNTESDGLPLLSDPAAKIRLSEQALLVCLQHARRVLQTAIPANSHLPWYTETWLEDSLRASPRDFDRAFNRWREEYKAAGEEVAATRRTIDNPRATKEERKKAERLEQEAKRQRSLLLCQGTQSDESDFNPHRYLASEGFLPGYNFPRLPIRAFMPGSTRDNGEYIQRPRFLGLREFGPRNVVYHEGRKYRVVRALVPPGGALERLTQAKLCRRCGYFHTGADVQADRCQHCNSMLDGQGSELFTQLLAVSAVATQRTDRITSDEEERLRQGYEITTHFRFAIDRGRERRTSAMVAVSGADLPLSGAAGSSGADLLAVDYASAATLWRLNRRWKRSTTVGYTLDPVRGYWAKRPDDNEEIDHAAAPEEGTQLLTGVVPYVYDTRNVLLVRPAEGLTMTDEDLLNLQVALQRGIQAEFQLEEQELECELIGADARRSILMWEASEGGAGVLGRLVDDSDAMARVARKALEICHFAPDGSDLAGTECARACYSCLLSYSNQPNHRHLNRHLVRDLLVQISGSITRVSHGLRDYPAHYQWLRSCTDDNSVLERKFLDRLYRGNRRLPDYAQHRIADIYACPDFYYEPDHVCVFCDGSVHNQPNQRLEDERIRAELADAGYRVLVIRFDENLDQQIDRHADVFGAGA